MNQISKNQHIASLITKEILGIINKAEKTELSEWLKKDEKHPQLYQKIKSQEHSKNLQIYSMISVEAGLKKYHKKYKSAPVHRISRWYSVAAIVFVLISIGITLLLPKETNHSLINTLQPGSSKALLTLANGITHELEELQFENEIRIPGVIVQNTGNEIRYIPSTLVSPPIQEEYNILQIPTGGEYLLLLADGTKVWLNSQTTLRYPVSFTGKERNVYLEGEAYFEVARDTNKPFYVRTKNKINVQVLGTAFNVRAYSDEQEVETVLEKGAVKMSQNAENVILTPGFKATYNKQNQKFSIQKVNTELYTAWHSGQYVFEKATIQHILQKLSRWYGMNVFYQQEEAKELIFSGNIRKYDTIENLLNAVEIAGGVHFEIKGKTIVVSCVH